MALLRTKSSMQKELQFKYDACNKFIHELNSVQNSLPSLMAMHQRNWKCGIQHPNFGPDEYGMFRTKDIATMSPDEVYLDAPGLFTLSITAWEYRKNRDMADLFWAGKNGILPDYYVTICEKYKKFLLSNLKSIRSQIFDNGIARENLCRNIVDALNSIEEERQGRVTLYRKVEILNKSISDNKIINCRIYRDGMEPVESSFLNLSGRFLLPDGFQKGIIITTENAMKLKYQDVMKTLSNSGTVEMFSLEPYAKKNLRQSSIGEKLSRNEAKENIRNVQMAEKHGIKFGL